MPLRYIAIAVLVLLLTACGWMPTLPVLSPYKMDIQQGNIVTQEMVAKLQPGMSRSQVRFVLGTPLVADMFHADRWDYVYRLEQGGRMVEERKIVAVFSGDKLLRIEGDVVPAATKPAATGAVPATAEKPAVKPEPAATDQPAAKP
jgi:outer membrane protein assembly factor BamE